MLGTGEHFTALRQFQDARRRANLQRLWARLTGRSADLLSFEEVRQNLGTPLFGRQVRKEIPLNAIVGSVGRYKDFTRTFLPLRDADQNRWASVKVAADGLVGLPPIEVYQLGDAYFVLDGNHRVSIAREAGAEFIEADVREVTTRVPLSADDDLDDLLLKSELAEFLNYTNLDRLCPGHQLRVTAPGQYLKLMELIDIHHYYMSREAGHKIPFLEAVIDWYDNVYGPVLQLIQERAMLREFPGRTATDLFVWISQYRRELSIALGWTVDTERAALDFAEQQGARPTQVAKRLADRVLDSVTPDVFESGPPIGSWRKEHLPGQSLFQEILVGCNGQQSGLYAFEQAIIIAERENHGTRVHGLHIVKRAEDRYNDTVRSLRTTCRNLLAARNIDGELVVQTLSSGDGSLASLLVARSGWANLLVVSLEHPPDDAPRKRLGSGMAQLLRRCPRPVMTVPHVPTPLAHGLLAFDGSPKAQEALFIASYLAGQWGIELTIVTVHEKGRVEGSQAQEEALAYSRQQGLHAEVILTAGPTLPALLAIAKDRACDFFILGGYGHTSVLEIVLGSTVDELLRTTKLPVLICR